MTRVKIITSDISDVEGMTFPSAVVALWAFSETTKTTGVCEDRDGTYDIETDIKAITYKVSFWYDNQKKAEGRPSRQLTYEEDGVYTNVFTVDLTQQSVTDMLESEVDHIETILNIIVADAQARLPLLN